MYKEKNSDTSLIMSDYITSKMLKHDEVQVSYGTSSWICSR